MSRKPDREYSPAFSESMQSSEHSDNGGRVEPPPSPAVSRLFKPAKSAYSLKELSEKLAGFKQMK